MSGSFLPQTICTCWSLLSQNTPCPHQSFTRPAPFHLGLRSNVTCSESLLKHPGRVISLPSILCVIIFIAFITYEIIFLYFFIVHVPLECEPHKSKLLTHYVLTASSQVQSGISINVAWINFSHLLQRKVTANESWIKPSQFSQELSNKILPSLPVA